MFYSGSQVNHNGILSFRLPFIESVPRSFPFLGPPLIAPFWDDVNIGRFGNIFFRMTSNVTLLQRARNQLQELFLSSGNFTPTMLFIATWDRVAQFRGGSQVYMIFTCLVLSDITIVVQYKATYNISTFGTSVQVTETIYSISVQMHSRVLQNIYKDLYFGSLDK